MTTTKPVNPDRRAMRNVIVLVAAQATLGAQMVLHFVLGGLAGQMLASDPRLATLPITMTVMGSMFAAPVLASIMQKYGRRIGFIIGTAGGAGGASVAAYALWIGSFWLFCFGGFLVGIYMAAQALYRFAATDTASPEFTAKAISWVMAGGLVAAILGPQLVKLTNDLFSVPFIGAYFTMIALNGVGVFLFFFLDIPKPEKPSQDAPKGRTRMQLLRTPKIAVAMICAMVSYSLMNLVMTSTPLAVVGFDYGTNASADVVMGHVLAMYVPSFFTGHLINRFGAEKIITLGLIILAAAGIVALSGIELMNFYVTLVLLGIGWNFGFIGATTMISTAHTESERGRVQGMNDFAVFGMVTVASFASGGLMNGSGGTAQQGWTAVNMAMIPFLLLAGGALIWFTLQSKGIVGRGSPRH
ncbi:MAG: MFS transporter [Rhodobacteraceae bacterium]|nr:MFS transporter [Paracoccaceae bacterium]